MSSPDATAARPAISPIISRPVFVDEGVPGFGGSGWYVGFNSLNDDQCNAPTTVVLSVVADGVTYSASIEVLSDEPTVLIDGWWVSCYPAMTPSLSVADATASEADGDVTFVVNVSPPIGRAERSEGPALAHEVSVDYSTAPDSASDGSDFRGVSGTLTIPAGTGRATISVPLVDDSAAERRERFRLTLSNAVGVEIAFYHADATIVDDDTLVADPVAPAAVCEEASLRASVGDVFDVGQSGFDRWNHVFVDLELSCGDALGRGMRHPTSVSVINGPNASRRSRQCLTRYDSYSLYETEAVSVANSCQTSADYSLDAAGATHVLRIPDTAIGEDHQMSAWVDADRDGELDAGEPYVIFGSDFASADLTEEGFYDYEFPEDFTVEIGPGSTRVGRGGHYSILVLRFTNPAGRTEVSHVGLPVAVDAALANLPAGVEISAGPSRGQEIICVNASGSGNAPASVGPCRTSDTGHLAVFYRVPLDGVDAHMQHDVLRIHYDRDRDGHFDHALSPYDTSVDTEPSRRLYLPVAKAANYIALGDSYSSGENGDTPESGAYQSGIGDADGECRRWDQAYPYIFNRNYLKNPQLAVDVTFKTFACTGAITHNIHNPADPHPTPPPETAHHTDRPSPHAALGRAVYLGEPPNQRVKHERDPRWEPRQGASLANFEAMRDVDMVTVTIGGNDAEFSDRIRSCALVRACNPTVSDALLAEIEQSAVDVLARVKQTAPDAAIFVLGYPYLTPEVDPCGNPREIPQPSSAGAPFVELDFSGLPDGCEAQWDMYFDAVDTCDSLSATGVVRGSLFYIIGAPLQEVLGDDRTRLDYREAKAMWAVADGLNAKLRSAAGRAGVHFVDVVGGVPLEDAPRGFVGHSSCNREDPWLNGFVVKSSRRPSLDGSDGSSFHPTAAGQAAYALLLEEYIKVQIEAGAVLSEAGLPVNPESSGHTGHGARGLVDSSPRSTGGQGDTAGAGGAQDSGSGRGRGAVQAVASVGLLVARPATQVSGCAAPFVSSGEQVTLSAAGFATDATVSFAARAMSLGDTQLTAPQIAATTADSDGAIAAVWAVPAVHPRRGRGGCVINASGGTHSTNPDTRPPPGVLGQVAVLTNDVAPTSTRAPAMAAVGDATSGAVTFTPDPGFWGTVETSMWSMTAGASASRRT